MKPPSLWIPEDNPHMLARVGKLGEECTELAKVCFRITIQGLDGIDPDNGLTNRENLRREMADVVALISINEHEVAGHVDQDRVEEKKNHKRTWFAMLAEHFRGTKYGPR